MRGLNSGTIMHSVWEEIRGFASAGEYDKFCAYIERQIASGMARERSADPSYHKGMIFGGRWFEELETKEVWRLIPSDFPFRGLFEKVELS
jgi:hypothetical protein